MGRHKKKRKSISKYRLSIKKEALNKFLKTAKVSLSSLCHSMEVSVTYIKNASIGKCGVSNRVIFLILEQSIRHNLYHEFNERTLFKFDVNIAEPEKELIIAGIRGFCQDLIQNGGIND